MRSRGIVHQRLTMIRAKVDKERNDNRQDSDSCVVLALQIVELVNWPAPGSFHGKTKLRLERIRPRISAPPRRDPPPPGLPNL